jgi:hypothetical protein
MKTFGNYLRFEVLTVVKMAIVDFWVVTACGLAGGTSGGIYHLHLQN